GRIPAEPDGAMQLTIEGRDDLPHHRVVTSMLPQQSRQGDGLEPVRVEIDDVDPSRRIAFDLVRCRVHPEARLAGGNQHGIVVGYPVHRAGPEAGYEPQQPVVALDSG